jgi:hypothetical protein
VSAAARENAGKLNTINAFCVARGPKNWSKQSVNFGGTNKQVVPRKYTRIKASGPETLTTR